MDIIEEIVLDKELFPGYTVIDEETPPQEEDPLLKKNVLKGLSKMNLFVGQNNSGKSRLLREIIKQQKTIKVVVNREYINYCNNLLDKFVEEVKIDLPPTDLEDFNCVKSPYLNIISATTSKEDMLHRVHSMFTNKNLLFPKGMPRDCAPSYREQLEKNYPIESVKTPYNFIYIPTLRGLIHLDGCDQKDLYTEKVQALYGLTDCDIFSGLDFNKRIRGQLLGNLEDRNSIQKYQEFLSKYLFNNQTVLLIPSENDSEGLKVKIGDEKEQKIHNLGDGLQTLIILTYPPFQSSKEKVLYFIEEPELSLHPGLQRQLLEAFQDDKYFGNVQFFITTHSNHLLDITLDQKDTSIYLLNKKLPDGEGTEKEPQFTIENVKHGDCRMLDTLGVSNSSVFLSNCTIWVEGITDRLYLGKYLKLYLDKEQLDFKEDIHYSFIEYSGNNITHWSFLDNGDYSTINYESITKKIFVILDEDNPDKKTERKEQIKKKLPNNHAVLPCREIENLLSPAIIKKVLESYGEQNVDSLKIGYPKYKTKYLGTYLDVLLGDKRKRKGNYAAKVAKPSTISDKSTFCLKALDHINEWEDLSEDAKALTIQIAEFIDQSNPKVPSTEQPIKS